MNEFHKKSDPLQKAIDEIRDTSPDSGQSEEAGARVWARLSEMRSEPQAADGKGPAPKPVDAVLSGCADYRELFDAYLDGRLSSPRTLLFEDHTRECFECRRALGQVRAPEAASGPRQPNRRPTNPFVWGAVAAAAILALVLGGGPLLRVLSPTDAGAVALSVTGRLFRVTQAGLEPMAPGDSVGVRTPVRTASDSGALLDLSDGSRVELGERTEVSVVQANDGLRIDVERGQMIVRAAPQGNGHLYVSTNDIDVEVVGTIFSVSEGSKGARVSVIEGEVRVIQSTYSQSLLPGEQYSSSESLTEVPIEEEIAWSQEQAEYMALVEAFSGLSEEIRQATSSPELRFDSTLLARVPEGTTGYVAFPNLARTLSTAYDVLVGRIESNAVTREWWSKLEDSEFDTDTLESMVGYLRSFSDQVGNEVVLAMVADGERTNPVLMTEVADAALMGDLLRGLRATGQVPLEVASSPEELAAVDSTAEAIAYVGDGLLALSPSHSILTEITSGTSGAFQSTAFHDVILDAYSDGVDWLVALDLDQIVVDADTDSTEEGEVFEFLGFSQLDDLVIEHKTIVDDSRTRAVMSFLGERTGLPSWIREAGPMGSLEFVSPDAMFVAGGLTRDAESVVQEILSFIQANSESAWSEIDEFQREHRFDLEYDLASTFGGEFIVAIDGPLLPTPSWKLVAEVYNSAILQNTIDQMVFEINRVAAPDPPVRIESEAIGGQIYYALFLSPENAIHYTYSGGYMIAGPSRGLVGNALQYRQSRLSLAASAAFRDLIPAGDENFCSAVAYQNVASSLAGLESWLSGLTSDGEAEGDETEIGADALLDAVNRPATLVCAVASADRIEVLNEGESPFAWMEFIGMMRLQSP